MPEDFEPKPITPSDEFAMHGNPHAVSGQANETFLLKAQQGHVLGTGGETQGFAKYQFADDSVQLNQAVIDLADEYDQNTKKSQNTKDWLDHLGNVNQLPIAI